jgi:hypothetical protein
LIRREYVLYLTNCISSGGIMADCLVGLLIIDGFNMDSHPAVRILKLNMTKCPS